MICPKSQKALVFGLNRNPANFGGMLKFVKRQIICLYSNDPQMDYYRDLDSLLKHHINPENPNVIYTRQVNPVFRPSFYKDSYIKKLTDDGFVKPTYNGSSLTDEGSLRLAKGGYTWEFAMNKLKSHMKFIAQVLGIISAFLGFCILLQQLSR